MSFTKITPTFMDQIVDMKLSNMGTTLTTCTMVTSTTSMKVMLMNTAHVQIAMIRA
ncbi:hypothetical protein [Stomatohabitans albus]|uniref:hypothetical protein n=1 Tax=Stomatohabitans albus TaxID=3110766 RepID=UPI00300C2992